MTPTSNDVGPTSQSTTQNNSTTGTTNGTTGVTTSSLGSTGMMGNRMGGYGSSYGSGYGGGMYGGGMYGGMGGMGGMYGGMNGMNGMNQQSGLMKFNQYIFQLCDVAQLVDSNANGLSSFFTLIKACLLYLIKFSKTTLVTFGMWLFMRSKACKEWVVRSSF